MNEEIVIDTLSNGNYVVLDKCSESFITSYSAFDYYRNMLEGHSIKFTRKALDEIQTGIENELTRQEELSQASYA